MANHKNYLNKTTKMVKTVPQKIGMALILIIKSIFIFTKYIIVPLVGLLFAIIAYMLTANIDTHDNLLNQLSFDQKKWFEKIENTTIKIENETCQTFKLNQNILDTNKPIASYNKFRSSEYWIDDNIIYSELTKFNGFISTLDKIAYMKDIDSLWVFARGYSDKSNMENKQYYLNNKYLYTQIDYYPSFYGEYFKINDNLSKRLSIENNKYMNNELNYLRANFVKEVYFKKLLKQLKYKNYHLKILEGKSISVRDKNLRKVDVYISFCKKNENLSIWDNFLIFIKELRLIFFTK